VSKQISSQSTLGTWLKKHCSSGKREYSSSKISGRNQLPSLGASVGELSETCDLEASVVDTASVAGWDKSLHQNLLNI